VGKKREKNWERKRQKNKERKKKLGSICIEIGNERKGN
jgi:hypothetical protein